MTDPFPGEPMSQHPAAELIAAYLSGTLPPPEQAALETHVAGCRPCRHEVTSARRIIRSRASRQRWLLVATAAAALLLLAVLTRIPPVTRQDQDTLRVGGGVEDEAPRIAAFSPADGDTVSRVGLIFVWARHEGRPIYQVTVTDPSGRAVWLRETPDTAVVPPPEILLNPGRTYYWYVDALDAAGGSLTTGTHRFTLAP